MDECQVCGRPRHTDVWCPRCGTLVCSLPCFDVHHAAHRAAEAPGPPADDPAPPAAPRLREIAARHNQPVSGPAHA